MSGGHSRRIWWVAAHRWLGLTLGLAIAFLGLTGSLIVFFSETDQLLNPMFVGTPGDATPPDALLAAAAKAYPDLGTARDIAYTRNVADFPPVVTMQGPSGPVEVAVDAASGTVLGRRKPADSFMWWVFDLHASFALSRVDAGEAAHLTLGIVAVLMLVLMLSGLVVWWPPNRRFRLVMTIKSGASGHRFMMDLHRVVGIYTFAVMLPITVTGIYLVKPDWVLPLLSPLGPARDYSLPAVASPGCGRTITATEALAVARTIRPDAALARIILPTRAGETYQFAFFHPDSPRQIVGGSENIVIDPTCGTILQVKSRADSKRQIVLDWMLPLHGGEAFGLVGKILVLIAGLVPSVLLATGLIIYLKRRRARLSSATQRKVTA